MQTGARRLASGEWRMGSGQEGHRGARSTRGEAALARSDAGSASGATWNFAQEDTRGGRRPLTEATSRACPLARRCTPARRIAVPKAASPSPSRPPWSCARGSSRDVQHASFERGPPARPHAAEGPPDGADAAATLTCEQAARVQRSWDPGAPPAPIRDVQMRGRFRLKPDLRLTPIFSSMRRTELTRTHSPCACCVRVPPVSVRRRPRTPPRPPLLRTGHRLVNTWG